MTTYSADLGPISRFLAIVTFKIVDQYLANLNTEVINALQTVKTVEATLKVEHTRQAQTQGSYHRVISELSFKLQVSDPSITDIVLT